MKYLNGGLPFFYISYFHNIPNCFQTNSPSGFCGAFRYCNHWIPGEVAVTFVWVRFTYVDLVNIKHQTNDVNHIKYRHCNKLFLVRRWRNSPIWQENQPKYHKINKKKECNRWNIILNTVPLYGGISIYI